MDFFNWAQMFPTKVTVVQGSEFEWSDEDLFVEDRSIDWRPAHILFVTKFYQKDSNIVATTSMPLWAACSWIGICLLFIAIGVVKVFMSSFEFDFSSIVSVFGGTVFLLFLVFSAREATKELHERRVEKFNKILEDAQHF